MFSFPLIGLAVTVFAATNVDDVLLLAAFFADRRFAARAVVAGQFLGIGVLTAASAGAAMAMLSVPEGWVALLGLAPLALGIRGLGELRAAEDEGELPVAADRSPTSPMLAVTAVTLANGGDNLGVYIPLFASNPSTVPVFASVFAVMTLLWCAAGFWLVRNRWFGRRMQRYGRAALPFVLIGLGLYILSGVRSLF